MDSIDSSSNVRLPLQVGQSFSRSLCLDAASIRHFATVAGDTNPLHYDQAAAERAAFGGLIASGGHTSSILAAMVASTLSSLRPSLGLEVSFQFRRPVGAGETMLARWQLTSIERKARLRADVVVFSGGLWTCHGDEVVLGRVVSLVAQ